MLLAGSVQIERDRATSLLDALYLGLPAGTIKAVASRVTEVITIENKTTFHSEAKRRQDDQALVIYTAGTPSPSWRAMYERLLSSLPSSTPILHWGDVDEGGFRIAATIASVAREAGFMLQPHAMSPADVPKELRIKASPAPWSASTISLAQPVGLIWDVPCLKRASLSSKRLWIVNRGLDDNLLKKWGLSQRAARRR